MALFNMLAAFEFREPRVLDLYAGLGTLGKEALSSGAASCDFVESNVKLCESLKSDLVEAGLEDRSRVLCMKVEKALNMLQGPYDIVVMDPPYDAPDLEEVVSRLAEEGHIDQRGLLVVEHSKRVALAESYGSLKRWRSRRHGDTVLDIYVRGEAWW
jgi:16S rRNA (guanine(966)-N(2))-methyltransferase RsmD